MKKSILCICVSSLIGCASSSLQAATAETTNSVESVSEGEPLFWPWTIGLDAGTTGFGVSASWRFADHFGARFGVDGVGYSQNQEIKGIHYDTKLRLLSEPLTFDIYPWKKHSFHISVGVQFNQNQLTGNSSGNTEIILDGQPFPINQVGSLNLKIEQQLVNPYLSIGGNFFYFDHAHHWALGGELGVAYTGDPKVSLTRSGPDAPLIDALVRHEQARVQDYADQFKFWPVLKIMVTYSF